MDLETFRNRVRMLRVCGVVSQTKQSHLVAEITEAIDLCESSDTPEWGAMELHASRSKVQHLAASGEQAVADRDALLADLDAEIDARRYSAKGKAEPAEALVELVTYIKGLADREELRRSNAELRAQLREARKQLLSFFLGLGRRTNAECWELANSKESTEFRWLLWLAEAVDCWFDSNGAEVKLARWRELHPPGTGGGPKLGDGPKEQKQGEQSE